MIPSREEINECVMENVVPKPLGQLAEAYLSGKLVEAISEDEVGFIIFKEMIHSDEKTAREYWTGKHHTMNEKARASKLAHALLGKVSKVPARGQPHPCPFASKSAICISDYMCNECDIHAEYCKVTKLNLPLGKEGEI